MTEPLEQDGPLCGACGQFHEEGYCDLDMSDGLVPSPELPLGEKFRALVDARSYGTIDGQIVDMTSANFALTLYDALEPKAQETFNRLSALQAVQIAFKVAK